MNPQATGLVVPLRVEALLVSAQDAVRYPHFLPPYADFTRLPQKGRGAPGPYLSSAALSQPFTGAAPLPQGVHLHWQLPRALRQGTTTATGELLMPAVPDRWLLTRVIGTAQGQLTTRSWVVESNYLSPDATYSATSIPVAPTSAQPQPYRYLGRVYDYADWAAGGGRGPYYEEPLTAMGFGIPDFATAYPNCGNVFAWHDAGLNAPGSFDPTIDTLTYVVTGWYSQPARDPLTAGDLNGQANRLGWLFAGTEVPTFTLLHGCVRAVGWDPASNFTYFPGGDDPLGTTLALGNTPAEAIAALAAQAPGPAAAPHLERLLSIFQDGRLPQLDRAGGLADAEAALFNNEFTAWPGGTSWEIQVAADQSAAAAPAVSAAQAQLLTQLNQTQQALDELRRQATTLQAQVYADWNKFMLIQYAANKEELPDLNDVFDFVSAELALLTGTLEPQVASTQTLVADRSATLAAQLPATLALASLPAPRYYQPNDPVLLLTGDGVPPPPPDADPTLACVLTSSLLSTVALPAGLVSGSAATTLPATLLPALVADAAALPRPAIVAASQATLLALPELAPALVALLAQQGGSTNPAVLDVVATGQALAAAQQAWLAATPPASGITFNGPVVQGSIAYRAWGAQPWRPLAISWQVNYYPLVAFDHASDAGYPADTVLRKLTFDASSFGYEYPAGTVFSAQLQQYQGTVLLGSAPAASLQAASRQLAAYQRDAGLAAQAPVPMLAQALSGFHAALLMRQPAMQLPIADPLATSQLYGQFSNVTVPAAVADQNQQTPQLNFLYNPFRAGSATLARLWLVDSFGQYRTVNPNYLRVSETIPTDPRTLGGSQPPLLYLPPRLAQPAQLHFRWLLPDASAPLSRAPGLSPVCGWVVPNHLDTSLLFYDADGAAIGLLFVAEQGTVLYWTNAPGTAAGTADLAEAFAPPRNAVLRQFALATYANGAAYVQALLQTLDATTSYVLPSSYQQDRATAVLLGTPLALVQATLGLDLLGLPSPDQSYDALAQDMDNGQGPLNRSVFGFTDLELPVQLGSLDELNDGLYGYFVPGPAAATGTYDFGTCYAAAATGTNAHIVAPPAGTLALTSGASVPRPLALLVDPRCEVHAYCGVLPVKAIGIPPELYATALSRLQFTFLAAPVLWPGARVTLPLPTEADGSWTWLARQADGSWQQHAIATPDQLATLQNAGAVAEGWLQFGPASSVSPSSLMQ